MQAISPARPRSHPNGAFARDGFDFRQGSPHLISHIYKFGPHLLDDEDLISHGYVDPKTGKAKEDKPFGPWKPSFRFPEDKEVKQ